MTTFESILLLAVTACVIITAFGVLVIKRMLKEIIDRKYANWEQLRKIETHTNFLVDISRQLDNIEDNILDESEGIPALVDIVDKMHRNLCVEIAYKMVKRTFPIKEGEPLDKPFDNPFVPSGATTWPPCYVGGPCTNPYRDCINCPRPNVSDGTWTTTSNKVETTNNEKSANSVSITEGRTDVTDGTLPDGAIIMQ